MRLITHREESFPCNVEGRLNAMLNVVNTELKVLTLLHLDDTPADEHEIRARVRKTVGKGCYLPRSDSFGGYCHLTLFPIGTVAEEEIIRDTGEQIHFGYRLTQAGKKYGRPIAAFTLEYAAQTGRSMFTILGSTVSSGKTRAPLNRIKILEALREKPLRKIDLEKIVGLNLTEIMISLQKIGFVRYDSVGDLQKGRRDVAPYVWVKGKKPEEVQIVRDKAATREIAQLMSELKKESGGKIAELTRRSRGRVYQILPYLEEQGFLRREKWKGGEFQSEAVLLDPAREFLDEYVRPFREAVSDGHALTDMQEAYERLMQDSDRLRESARKVVSVYKQVSPNINKRPRQETNERIIAYLAQNPGARNIEIGRKFGLSNMTFFLTPLVKSGILRKEKQGKEVRYYVNK